MKKTVYFLVVAFALLATAIVSKAESAPDPLAEFKLHLKYLKEPHENVRAKSKSQWDDIQYDVRKTDSLVSPFFATLSATVKITSDGLTSEFSYDAQFVYQDDQWMLKKLTVAVLYKGEVSISWQVTPSGEQKAFWDKLEREMKLKTLHVQYD